MRLRGAHGWRDGARALAARLAACGLALSLMAGLAQAQLKLKIPGGSNPFGDAAEKAQEDLFTKAAAKLLDEQLPINLDASHVLPTVSTLPGGPFAPRPLPLTQANMTQPLAPGDYTVNVFAFCTEYSVHQPGQGVAYELAPLEGKLSGAVATLLWRGIRAGVDSHALMGAAWAIQSGLTYAQMPKGDQALIDRLIPDFKPQLEGDFLLQIEASYQLAAKAAKLPTLPQLLAKMGEPGELALDALAMQQTLLRANTTDEIREQTLFAGQESGVYAPVKAEEGPWTVRIPGVAYVRYRIQGGNLAGNNIVEIRIMPAARQDAARQEGQAAGPRLVNASFVAGSAPAAGQTQAAAPTLENLLGADESNGQLNASGLIGYSVGRGAQALIPVLPPPVSAPPPPPNPVQILRDLNPITDANRTVVVGERIALTLDTSGIASGASVASVNWTVPGTTVGNYVPKQQIGTVTPSDFTQPAATFYFVDQGGGRVVKADYTLSDGTTGEASATLIVVGPTGAGAVMNIGHVKVGTLAFTNAQNAAGASKGAFWDYAEGLFLGGLSPQAWFIHTYIPGMWEFDKEVGIEFTGSAKDPVGFPGKLSWVQLITLNQSAQGPYHGAQGTGLLDNRYPYQSNTISAGEYTNDAPAMFLMDGNTMESATESFGTYLMWTPAVAGDVKAAIPVPLGIVNWHWSGTAIYDASSQSWSLANSPKADCGYEPFALPVYAAPNFGYPVWTGVQGNIAPPKPGKK